MTNPIELHINGNTYHVEADSRRSLLSVLRDELDLTGAKYGCGEGQCGACTVLVESRAVRSCITPVVSVQGKRITTIEGLGQNGRLHPLQQAFLETDALQCGYCTPGMILSGVAVLTKNPQASAQQILRAMEGNLCRCGAYSRILTAILKTAEKMKVGSSHE